MSTQTAMFEHFREAKFRKAPPWAYPLFAACVMFVALIFITMWIKGIWDIEQLERPKTTIDLAVAPPPPPPPPPPPGGAKPHDVITPKKIKVKDIVQPVKHEQVEQKAEENNSTGVEGGEEGGVEGGVVGGVMGAPPPPPPPPPPPAPPQNVAPAALEAQRIAGEKMIEPDDVTKTEIQRSGKDRVIASFKLCLTIEGSINSVNMLKSSSFPAYDNKILSTIRGTWRYKPFNVNGKPVPVCTAVTFIYSQK